MKYIRMLPLLATAVLVSACATVHVNGNSVHQCTDSPKSTVAAFVQGIADFHLRLIESMTEGGSVLEAFGNGDKRRGKKVIDELLAHPELLDGKKGCACKELRTQDTADPKEKIVVMKRTVLVDNDDDEMRDYQRAFLVRFGSGNCVLWITPIDPHWVRLHP